jgi:hypothetical protein
MKLGELIRLVDKSKNNTTAGDIEDFARELIDSPSYGYSQEFSDRIKGYWIQKWLCTDSWVGLTAWFWDDEPLATSWQPARKSTEVFQFVNKDIADRLRVYIKEILGTHDPEPDFVNLEEDLGESYTVNWASELLVDEAFYEGQKVKIIGSRRSDYSRPSAEWKLIDVEFPNGDVFKASVENLHIPYHIVKPEEESI